MGQYEVAFSELNAAQREAVTAVDGPVLVVAGPGTGKTQLLSVRVAHILAVTDTLPQNILCLTFTENGAENMRERLARFIGKEAYDVTISTYHAFGADLIQRYPEIFAETRLQTAADELTRRQVLRDIIVNLPYHHPLKQLRHHLGDLVSTVSEIKRAQLTTDDLRAIAAENTAFIDAANRSVGHCFEGFTVMPRSVEKAIVPFERLLGELQGLVPGKPAHAAIRPLAAIAVTDLAEAIRQAAEAGKTPPLTAWKNDWLAKDDENRFVFGGALETQRIGALADVFNAYEESLREHGWYDFDDMINRATAALEQKPDLRFSLQERYQYILLDEFQDTNAAQLTLVRLLSDNPVNERKPNVFAVGDDDQAIYAFQGAHYSNMLDFLSMYEGVRVIQLTDNYRSTPDILLTARNIADQITDNLDTRFGGKGKRLRAVKRPDRVGIVERQEFLSDVAQYDWIAHEIKRLIDSGTAPRDVAVLAPKHRYIQPLVPFLAALNVPVSYEKRENVLEAPAVRQLVVMSRLLLAVADGDEATADALWPEILSFDFWNIPVGDIWRTSWQIRDNRRNSGGAGWSQALLESSNPSLRLPALLMLALAGRTATETCEQMLDYLIGTCPVPTGTRDGSDSVASPFRSYYLSESVQQTNPGLFYETISHLTVLRAKLREYGANQTAALSLRDLIGFVSMYEEAEERLLNTSPYNQQADAVQLMTVHKAKGLEFEQVFLPSCHDDVWGSASRALTNRLTLPQNLAPIRHAGATEDERLRLLFVAITRAKTGLHLTSFSKTYTGKVTPRLKYFDEIEQDDGTFLATVLPEHSQRINQSDRTVPSLASLELNWRQRHIGARADESLKSLLSSHLSQFQLSPTHLTRFIDLDRGGPEDFFFRDVLQFPLAPTVQAQYGDAMHATLEWVQREVTANGAVPSESDALRYFAAVMGKSILTPGQIILETERGQRSLAVYLREKSDMFRPTDRAEFNFRHEGVFAGKAHLSGKTDRLEVDHTARTVTVVDYKTGSPQTSWKTGIRPHKYAIQLYCYKLLVENSHTFRGYRVTHGRIEFVDPDNHGRINTLETSFDETEMARIRKLLQAVWRRTVDLDMPDTSGYEKTLAGVRQFEDDLIA